MKLSPNHPAFRLRFSRAAHGRIGTKVDRGGKEKSMPRHRIRCEDCGTKERNVPLRKWKEKCVRNSAPERKNRRHHIATTATGRLEELGSIDARPSRRRFEDETGLAGQKKWKRFRDGLHMKRSFPQTNRSVPKPKESHPIRRLHFRHIPGKGGAKEKSAPAG